MENKLQLIKQEHFGEIEADIYSNGKDMFMTINQLAECLEYSTRRGVEMLVDRNEYLKGSEFSVTHKLCAADGKQYETRIFTEDGIYEITMLSGQPKAKEFRAWIRKILKALRTGKAKITSITSEDTKIKRIRADAMALNAATKTSKFLTEAYQGAGMDPRFTLIAVGKVFSGMGLELPMDNIPATEKLYECTAIAEELGLVSEKGNPHKNAVAAIIELVGVDDSEVVVVPFATDHYANGTKKYKLPVLERVRAWLQEHGYPTVIQGADGKNYKARYTKEVA